MHVKTLIYIWLSFIEGYSASCIYIEIFLHYTHLQSHWIKLTGNLVGSGNKEYETPEIDWHTIHRKLPCLRLKIHGKKIVNQSCILSFQQLCFSIAFVENAFDFYKKCLNSCTIKPVCSQTLFSRFLRSNASFESCHPTVDTTLP